MDKQTIDSANKAQFRALCKRANISYGKLTVGGMRDALPERLRESDAFVGERLSDTPVI